MKVLLVVIDGATPRVVCPAVRTGALPTLRKLMGAGCLHDACTTIFPSITPAATTTLVTGAYPVEHGIAGASWYDEERGEVAYYGDDFWVIAREGFGAFLNDFLVRLNGGRLRVPTLFETVEQAGRRSGSLNYLVYRGPVPHRVEVPWQFALLPGVPRALTVMGPSMLSLGSFIRPRARRRKVKGKEGLLHRFGMDDASSGRLLCEVMARGALPDFTVAYFADNDFRSHEAGPHAALPAVFQVDRMLGQAITAGGGLERVLSDTTIVVTSDHGHCEVLDDPGTGRIRLDDVLGEYRQAALARAWRPRDQIMICPNMRAAQIYLQRPAPDLLSRVTEDLLREERIDQVIFRTALARSGVDGYTVASRRGRLAFVRADARAPEARDANGNRWRWEGEPGALALDMVDGVVDSAEYPNALERIAGVLDAPNSGELWVTAVPGCEFEMPGGKAHVGGASHGALHALDSLTPVLVAGAGFFSGRGRLPRHMRSVDVAPLCLEALGLAPGRGGR